MSEIPSKAPLLAPTEPRHFRSSSSMALSRLRSQPQPQAWNTSGARHSSNPIVHSPLQQSFPAYPNSASEEASNSSPMMQQTPSRRSRRTEHESRKRGESRSSSVPIIVRTLEEDSQPDCGHQLQARTRPHSRATSPLPRAHGRAHETNFNPLNPNANRRSVKHLTCFWWWEKGECRFSEEDCLYAHHDTGHYTLAPRQVVPGEPAKAGKSLERALNKLAIANRSSASLSSLANAPVQAYEAHNNAVCTNVDPSSHPETPQAVECSRSSTPSPLEIGQGQAQATRQLQTDNDFLRSLVQETQREKRALVDTIESLQKEKLQLQSRIEAMSSDRGNLLFEREVLQATVKKLQFTNTSSNAMSMRSPTTSFGPSLSQSPWGAIGSRRPSPVEGVQQSQRTVSDGSTDLANNKPSNSSLVNNIGTHAALDLAAMPQASPDARLSNDFSSLGDGNEGEKLKSVLRSLGPTF
ncbi:hypothetical protein A1O3_01276 [Capronia epimyces CBS 606.96]|uniref:C3H1-type domain-containing protein n=1 Tax=Capronia epimyces CBS 606.96 TaxID=1182542 RepID=W9ZDX0_9EURO|nr:uncharacterized protein A1O3_01276 [Capronia epimyces CBS 606.96]EXJ92724.1 hypothetical protein A1O3_01276 [Capronia epimyces CBS 606.96]